MFDRAHYTSYANNTKWSELREAMLGLYPRAPQFRVKTLDGTDEKPWNGEWDGEWYYHFRSDYEWKDMEWVDLRPKASDSSASSDELAEICRRIGLDIERNGDIVRVIGYRKHSYEK